MRYDRLDVCHAIGHVTIDRENEQMAHSNQRETLAFDINLSYEVYFSLSGSKCFEEISFAYLRELQSFVHV